MKLCIAEALSWCCAAQTGSILSARNIICYSTITCCTVVLSLLQIPVLTKGGMPGSDPGCRAMLPRAGVSTSSGGVGLRGSAVRWHGWNISVQSPSVLSVKSSGRSWTKISLPWAFGGASGQPTYTGYPQVKCCMGIHLEYISLFLVAFIL